MRFVWLTAVGAAMTAAAPAAAGEFIGLGFSSSYDGGYQSYAMISGMSRNPVLESLVLKDGKPGATVQINSVNGGNVIGYFDDDGRFTLPGPRAIGVDAIYGRVVRARFTSRYTSKSSSFRVESYAISGDAVAVPEPATWLMMIMGFAAIGGALRYRARRLLVSG